MKLYEMTGAPNPRRVRIFLAEKGITVPFVQVDMRKGEHKAAEFLKKNPSGKIPVLELDDGTCIAESVAICRYFEALHPKPSLFGATPKELGRIEMVNRQLEFELLGPIGAVLGQRTHRRADGAGTVQTEPAGERIGRSGYSRVLQTSGCRIGRPRIHGRQRLFDCRHHCVVRHRLCCVVSGVEARRRADQSLALARGRVVTTERQSLIRLSIRPDLGAFVAAARALTRVAAFASTRGCCGRSTVASCRRGSPAC